MENGDPSGFSHGEPGLLRIRSRRAHEAEALRAESLRPEIHPTFVGIVISMLVDLLGMAALPSGAGTIDDAGVISTAGNLVFQGQTDGQFKAYAAVTGRELWSFAEFPSEEIEAIRHTLLARAREEHLRSQPSAR